MLNSMANIIIHSGLAHPRAARDTGRGLPEPTQFFGPNGLRDGGSAVGAAGGSSAGAGAPAATTDPTAAANPAAPSRTYPAPRNTRFNPNWTFTR